MYALHKKLKITQFNVQSAFLHVPLPEDVFIKKSKGVNRPTPYLKLKKSLYGLKQSPKNWYETLTGWLHSIRFMESSCDLCLYICNDSVAMIFFHIDDLILVVPGNNFEKEFKTCFSNSLCHKPNTILGMKFERDGNMIKLSLPNHIEHGEETLIDFWEIKNKTETERVNTRSNQELKREEKTEESIPLRTRAGMKKRTIQ